MIKPVLKTVSINDTFEILGHKINGYKGLRKAVDVSSTPGESMIQGKGKHAKKVWFIKPYITADVPANRIRGLHVLEIYQRYPCFDSSDYAYENRYYRNFFFSEKPFTKEEIERIAEMKRFGNLEYITDEMPEWALPSVYYVGDGEKMILAL